MPSNASHEARSSAAIYSQLKEMVVSYAFSPSQQLQPWSLADAFKVSATPVREALIRLNAEGLVLTHPNKGFFMKPLNVSENCELYMLRSQLVKCSVEHIIEHAKTATLNRLTEGWLFHLDAIREGVLLPFPASSFFRGLSSSRRFWSLLRSSPRRPRENALSPVAFH